MTAPINPPDLDTALKSLWGASQLPFGAAVETPYASDTFKETRRRLEQLVAVRACGLLHGPNGVGKTLLVQHFLQALPDKRYKSLVLSHSSVTGTDLLRLLCLELGQTARLRRSDNVPACVPGLKATTTTESCQSQELLSGCNTCRLITPGRERSGDTGQQ